MNDLHGKIFKNYVLNMVYQVFMMIAPLITTPYISRVLGAENIGIYSYTLSIATYFIIAGGLGFPLYGQREIAIAASDRKKRSKVFFEVFYGQVILLSVSLILYFSFVFLFLDEYRTVFLVQSISIIGGALATSWLYLGLEEFSVTVKKNVIVKVCSIVAIFLFVNDKTDLKIYILIMALSNICGNLFILVGTKKYVDVQYAKVKMSGIIQHIKPSFILGIPYYLTSLYTVIDRTMLGMLENSVAEVGYYEQSQKIITLVTALTTSLGVVLMPRMANQMGNRDDKALRKYLFAGLKITMLISIPCMIGLIVIGDTICPWFFGTGYEKVGGLIKVFAPLTVLLGINNLIITQYFVATKKEKILIVFTTVGVITNVIFNIILIPKFGSYGAAVASVLSEMLKMVLALYYERKIIELHKLLKCVCKYLGYSLVMGGILVIYRLSSFAMPAIADTILLIVVGVASYFLLLCLTKDEHVLEVVRLINEKLRFKKRNR